MAEVIKIAELEVEIDFKEIKNVHLSVNPPLGHIKVSAPTGTKIDSLRGFLISKLQWMRQEKAKFAGQPRETEREYIDRESHYLWGERHLLKIEERVGGSGVRVEHKTIVVSARGGIGKTQKLGLLSDWYRDQLRSEAGPMLAKWEAILGVKANGLYVQQMKTRWGSSNPSSATIRLNTELAKKPRECLEYIIVHELVHLIEPSHGTKFETMMTQAMPDWKHRQQLLNSLPTHFEP
jgi:predicted metal-dependent hydrolase